MPEPSGRSDERPGVIPARPPHSTRTVLLGLLIVPAMVAALMELAAFYFRLGGLLPVAWLFGVTAVIVGVRRLRGAGERRALDIAAALVAYVLATSGLHELWFGQQAEITVPMTWEDRGRENSFAQPEIVLRFVDYPAFFEGTYSEELATYLHASGLDTVDVTFHVVRDLGCLRGTSARKVLELDGWSAAFGYAGREGSGTPETSPWGPDSFWCP